MPKFSIFHQKLSIFCNPVIFADGSSFNLLGIPCGQGLQHQNNSDNIKQVDHRNILHIKTFTGMLLSKLYWHILCCPMWQISVIWSFKQAKINVNNNCNDSFLQHKCTHTCACICIWRYSTMSPPHCESPHSAVALSAAGPAGCGSLSLGQCAGWTGPLDTVTGCRTRSH